MVARHSTGSREDRGMVTGYGGTYSAVVMDDADPMQQSRLEVVVPDVYGADVPVWAVALGKVVSGAIQAVIASLVVFVLATFIPATPVHLHVHWFYLVTLLPFSAIMSAALGLTIGTRVEPRQVPLLFSLLVIPMTFLGAVYYPWQSLTPLAWLKWSVLVNPLIYVSEGMRLSLTKGVPHMPVVAVYAAIIAFTAVFLKLGVDGFKKRVLS